ncbi:MAG: ABC transporter substrate-binding protein, partial [Acidimicrobiia bacterium]
MLAAAAALVVAAGLAGSADGAGSRARADAPKGGTLRIGSHVDVDSVDTALGYTATSGLIADATCARLFHYRGAPGAAGARVLPEVVRSFSVSRDGRTYSFQLRGTFRFHTGARVTARSFADAFNRDADPRLPSAAKAFMHEIVGADAVIDGKADSISGVRVLGRFRLQLQLTKRVEDLTARLTHSFFCPILPNTSVDREIDNPAGSGPYYVAERIPNQRVVLRRNPYYRGSVPANVDEMVWTIGGTVRDCQRAVEEDRLDLCSEMSAPRDAWRDLAERYGVNRPGGQVFASPSQGTWYFAFNHNRPAFNGLGQIPLKKAINFAIDRPALARTLGFLGVKRTDQMLPPALARA